MSLVLLLGGVALLGWWWGNGLVAPDSSRDERARAEAGPSLGVPRSAAPEPAEQSPPPRRVRAVRGLEPPPLPRDPRLVPGQPPPQQDPPPEALEHLGAGALPADPRQHRSPRNYPEPAVVLPEVPARPPGVPPTPQGAGGKARAWVRGEESVPEPPGGDADARRAELQALLASRSEALRGCGAASWTVVIEASQEEGGWVGFPAEVFASGGEDLAPEQEACLLRTLEALAWPTPLSQREVRLAWP